LAQSVAIAFEDVGIGSVDAVAMAVGGRQRLSQEQWWPA